MGIRTIAVYSDADRDALHVRQADEAVHIGPSRQRKAISEARRSSRPPKATGAEAVHPGYGFLSRERSLRAGCDRRGAGVGRAASVQHLRRWD